MARGQQSGASWRVMLVRRGEQPVPGEGRLEEADLPAVVRVTQDLAQARDTAERLRALGCAVVIIEEHASRAAFCPAHMNHLATRRCALCGERICERCLERAGGEATCPQCLAGGRSPRYRTRLRQLFMFFMFSVFCFEVWQYIRDDRAAVDPGGSVHAAILQYVEPSGVSAPIVHHLNGRTTPTLSGPTLHDLASWMNNERQRYGGGIAGYLRTDIVGPWSRSVRPPPLGMPGDPPWLLLRRSWSYSHYFRSLAHDGGIDLGAYGVRIFVIYGEAGADTASHSRGSANGRLAVCWIDLEEQNAAYAVLTVAHELGHALGALDTYDPETSRAKHPEGYVEPFATSDHPLVYPQRFAELMAVDIPVTPAGEREVSALSQVRVGHATAAGMGWIEEDDATAFYRPPGDRPQDLLGEPDDPPRTP